MQSFSDPDVSVMFILSIVMNMICDWGIEDFVADRRVGFYFYISSLLERS